MRHFFTPKLVNSVFGDPAIFVPFSFQKRAVMFDLGDISSLTPKDILKISHIFISHTHMDHFFGFDRLLRIMLGRAKKLYLFGPKGFIKNIEGKLKGYSWNLVKNYSDKFIIYAREIRQNKIIARYYECSNRFRSEKEEDLPFSHIIHKEPSFEISAEILDHSIECLGFSMKEKFSINIITEKLKEMNLAQGAWISDFKAALYNEELNDKEFEVYDINGKKHNVILKELAEKIAKITRGERIVYITDVGATRKNIEKIINFAKDCDQLFIETYFSDEEEKTALNKYHLTAKQAGEIAKKAEVKKMTAFHFSPRYANDEEKLINEANNAFYGGSAWESNPPGTVLAPHTGFEVREPRQRAAHFH